MIEQNVVACYRDPVKGDSRLTRLEDLFDDPELVARGPLGQLMSRGVLENYLKSQKTRDQKREQALDWFESLREQVEAA